MAAVLEGAEAAALVQEVKDNFQFNEDSEGPQRALEREDNAFASGGRNQWPDQIWKEREGIPGQVPSRPSLTFNTVKPPIMQISNAARAARLGIVVKPKGSEASKKQALYRQGVIRQIEIDSVAPVARLWALDRALRSGRGYYRLRIDWANDGDFDQDIIVDRILDQDSVRLDPTIQQPTGEDAEWGIIAIDLTTKQYVRAYGKSALAKAASLDEFGATGYRGGWVRTEDGEQKIRVAEYYKAHYDNKVLLHLPDGTSVLEEKATPQQRAMKDDEREVPVRRIVWYKINATEVLEQRTIPGPYIPIVLLIGEEEFVNGQHIFKGIVRDAKDPARSYNYMRSKQVEAVGLAPVSPWVMAEGQDEGYKEQWATANTKAWDSLKYKPKTFGAAGQLIPPPQRNVVEPAIQAITLAAHEARQDVKDITGFGDPGLGHGNPNEKSGKAIIALQRQSELGSSNYTDNLARSVTFEAKIINSWLKFVYTTKGRILRIVDEEDQTSGIIIGVHFTKGPDGEPVPVPPQQQPQQPGMMQRFAQRVGIAQPPTTTQPQGQEAEFVDFSKGDFSVTVTVGKSHQTQREEEDEAISSLIDAAPQLAPLIADIWIEGKDFKNAPRIAKRLKRALPPGVAEKDEQGQGQVSPEVQQKMQMLEEQNGQLTEALKKETEALKIDQAKADADARIAQAKIQADAELKRLQIASDEKIAQLKILADLLKTRVTLHQKSAQAELEAEITRLTQEIDLAHETRMAEESRRHEVGMGEADSAHAAEQADADAQRQAALAEQGAGHDAAAADRAAGHQAALADQSAGHQADLLERQAALEPPPEEGAT